MSDNLRIERKPLIKFILLVGLLFSYFLYLSQEYGAATGFMVSALTWSFFVLCTPIADGGFLLDFPIRLLFKIPMVHSEILVWGIAISLNIFALSLAADSYETTEITRLLHQILTHPYPFWGIILLSCMGTFLSLIFGDHLYETIANRNWQKIWHGKMKWELLGMIGLFVGIVISYYLLIQGLDIHIGH